MTTRIDNKDSSALTRDMNAWAKWTESQLPDIADTRRQLVAAAREPEPRERRRTQRRWIAAVAIALVALVLLIPLPVERSVGRDVSVTLSAPELAQDRVAQIARVFQYSLASNTSTTTEAEPGTFVITTRTTHSRLTVDDLTGALRELLESSGLAVDIQIIEAYEIVRQSVYAHITDRHLVLEAPHERSAEEIQADLRAQLDNAGLSHLPVEVNERTKGSQRTLEIKVGDDQARLDELGIDLRFKDAIMLDVEDARGDDERMSAEIKRQLRALGIDVEVEVNGKEIQIFRDADAAPPTDP